MAKLLEAGALVAWRKHGEARRVGEHHLAIHPYLGNLANVDELSAKPDVGRREERERADLLVGGLKRSRSDLSQVAEQSVVLQVVKRRAGQFFGRLRLEKRAAPLVVTVVDQSRPEISGGEIPRIVALCVLGCQREFFSIFDIHGEGKALGEGFHRFGRCGVARGSSIQKFLQRLG